MITRRLKVISNFQRSQLTCSIRSISTSEVTEQQNDVDSQQAKSDDSNYTNYLIVVGFDGQNFKGSAFQKDQRSVEGEVGKALVQSNILKKFKNYKSKQLFERSSRVDKQVSALSLYLQVSLPPKLTLEQMKAQLQPLLPSDIHLYDIKHLNKGFSVREQSSSREYFYYLPSFCLLPYSSYLTTEVYRQIKSNFESEDIEYEKKMANANSMIEPYLKNMCGLTIDQERIEFINKEVCQIFLNGKWFHNHIRKRNHKDYDNKKDAFNSYFRTVLDFKIDKVEDVIIDSQNVQLVRFYIKGKSFGYNMIRKMIFSVFEIACLNGDIYKLQKSFDQKVRKRTYLAPSQGLLLWKADYQEFFERVKDEFDIEISDETKVQMDDFHKEMVDKIARNQLENKEFSQFLMISMNTFKNSQSLYFNDFLSLEKQDIPYTSDNEGDPQLSR